jgi:N-acetyl-gamma-glutamyl-phosphate reductase
VQKTDQSANNSIRVGVVGATGYTGAELLRLLLRHPDVDLRVVTSRADAGVPLSESWPNLRNHTALRYVEPNVEQLAAECELVFFATPHTVAMAMVATLLERGCKVIDLSADFRIKDIALWEQWYDAKHLAPDAVAQAVYGLPEVAREQIRDAQLIACPGCYPTAVQLGFLPLLEQGLIDPQGLIANAASGVSGAGRQAKIPNLFAELSDSFKAYGVSGHRHLPEIEQGLSSAAGQPVSLTFVPHLLPTIRGIHATLYAQPNDVTTDWQAVFEQRYADEPFVDVLPAGNYPEMRSVKGTNNCRIAVQPIAHSNRICIMSVIDNLGKGAAGQAVQAMNIAYRWPETRGLTDIALLP